MVFFPVPGVIFDLASFSFQTPICGLAKQSVPAAKHSARVSSDVFVFMSPFQTGIGRAVNIFSNETHVREMFSQLSLASVTGEIRDPNIEIRNNDRTEKYE